MIHTTTHPQYKTSLENWVQWRLSYEGGQSFITAGLHPLSSRETNTEFLERKALTYAPAHAKAAVNRVKNSLAERLVDVSREDTPDSFEKASKGNGLWVDHDGNTMNSFVSREILPELLPIGKVGVFVDRKPIMDGASKKDTLNNHPYLYTYRAEDIRSWSYDDENELEVVLLRNYVSIKDDYGLIKDVEEEFMLLTRSKGSGPESSFVTARFFDKDSDEIPGRMTDLKIPMIPFVIIELSSSLMTDISDHQVSLLNMASLDVAYLIKANFPFYTEQVGFQEMSHQLMAKPEPRGADEDYPGTQDSAELSGPKEVKTGTSKGRSYGPNLDRPGFIHPSSEPLLASMKKEQDIIDEINTLLNLTIQTLHPTRASAESKEADNTGMISGLSVIGQELQYAETQIVKIWAAYEKSTKMGTIKYPVQYTLKSDAERLAEVGVLKEDLPILPSLTYQKEVAKQIAKIMLGSKVSESRLKTIMDEIEAADIVVIDPEVINGDIEAGTLSRETGSKARGYPAGEVEKAALEHAERAKRIAEAQSIRTENASRGVSDNDVDASNNNREEKESSRDDTFSQDQGDKTRGEGK
jgi:hypothetical protein